MIVAQGSQLQAYDKIDFSKPERFIREMLNFLNSVTLVTHDINVKQKNRTMSSTDAQLLLQHLMELIVPNLTKMPAFNPKEI